MPAKRDFYDILGVAKSASEDDIKKAYRKLVRQHHPDHNPGDKQAEARFREIQEAYDILAEKESRAKYDRFGHAAFDPAAGLGAGGGGPGPGAGRSAEDGPYADMQFSTIEELLGQMSGRGRRRGRPAAGRDIEVTIAVPLRLAVLGGPCDVTLPDGGSVEIAIPPGTPDGTRLRLAGKGEPGAGKAPPGNLIAQVQILDDPVFVRNGADLAVELSIGVAEAILGGPAEVPTLEGAVTLNVPPGTSSGQKLRLRGKGVPDRAGGRGDLLAQVRIVVPKRIDEESRRLIEQFAARNPR